MAELKYAATADELLSQFRCVTCGYGASCKIAPERCPMCGSGSWEHEEPRRRDGSTPSASNPLN